MLPIRPKTNRTVLALAALATVGALQPLRKDKEATPDTSMFCRIGKVDVTTRTVYGRLAQEVPDASGEIFDYDSSKPYFEKWVEETKEASKGKSLGNIRAMHGNVAAGKATEITFQDDEKAIDIAAKIVDDNEWDKVLEGVYTGFSIGGVYVGEKRKDGDLMRYTAAPIEASLVDKPCIPTAMFSDIVKAKGFDVVEKDGKTVHKEFKAESLEPPKEPKVVKADPDEPEVSGTQAEVDSLAKLMGEHKLDLGGVVELIKGKYKAAPEKKFADEANKKYPLDNDAQVIAAWYFAHTTKASTTYKADELEALKTNIATAWAERFGKAPDVPADAKKGLAEQMTKGFYNVASAASLLNALAYFMADCEYYEEAGMVGEGVTSKAVTALQAMGDVVAMLLQDAVTNPDDDDPVTDYMKGALATLTKAGARNSKKDSDRIQKAHDLMKELGAGCGMDKAHTGDLDKGLKAQLEALQKRLDKVESMPQPAKATLRVVEKAQDNQSEPEGLILDPVLNSDGKMNDAATLIKLAHKLGAMRVQA